MLAWTWGTWPDPIADVGKELYLAWQLSLGRRLYVDVAFHLGPLSPYFNALAFKLFGPTLATLVGVNLLVCAGILVLDVPPDRPRVAGTIAATAGGVTLCTLFAFTHFTPIADYNYLCPYDHEHTHGLLLGLLALTAIDRHARTGRRTAAAGAGLCLGLAFLTRAELFVAAAAGVGATLAASCRLRPRGSRRPALLDGLTVVGSALVPVLLAFAGLACVLPTRWAFAAWRGRGRAYWTGR